MDSRTRQLLITAIPSAVAGGGAALMSANAGDDPLRTGLISGGAGLTAALAGRYGGPLLKDLALKAGRKIKNQAGETIRNMRGTGIPTAMMAAPAALAAGGLGGALTSSVTSGLNKPAMDSSAENEMQYVQALMDEGLVDDGSMAYLDSYPEYSMQINPEAYGVSSNTDSARMGMVSMV